MNVQKSSEEILRSYKLQGQAIIRKMHLVLLRAQRKIDDEAYRTALEKLEKIKSDKH